VDTIGVTSRRSTRLLFEEHHAVASVGLASNRYHRN
jgi:hypothetical protein